MQSVLNVRFGANNFVFTVILSLLCALLHTSESRSLKDSLRIVAIMDSVTNLERYVDITGRGSSPWAPSNFNGLTFEYVDSSYIYFTQIDKQLETQIKCNLPKIRSFEEVLQQNHPQYLRLKQRLVESDEPAEVLAQRDSEYLSKLAVEYKKLVWPRLTVPDLNPAGKESSLGKLIDSLTDQNECAVGQASTSANNGLTWELIKQAEDEFTSELKDITRVDRDFNEYHALERIDSYFSSLMIRVANEKIISNPKKPSDVNEYKRIFVDGLKEMGFQLESLTRLKRIG